MGKAWELRWEAWRYVGRTRLFWSLGGLAWSACGIRDDGPFFPLRPYSLLIFFFFLRAYDIYTYPGSDGEGEGVGFAFCFCFCFCLLSFAFAFCFEWRMVIARMAGGMGECRRWIVVLEGKIDC